MCVCTLACACLLQCAVWVTFCIVNLGCFRIHLRLIWNANRFYFYRICSVCTTRELGVGGGGQMRTLAPIQNVEGSMVFASRALVVVYTALYLTSHNDWLVSMNIFHHTLVSMHHFHHTLVSMHHFHHTLVSMNIFHHTLVSMHHFHHTLVSMHHFHHTGF